MAPEARASAYSATRACCTAIACRCRLTRLRLKSFIRPRVRMRRTHKAIEVEPHDNDRTAAFKPWPCTTSRAKVVTIEVIAGTQPAGGRYTCGCGGQV